MDEAERLCDRVAIMDRGKILALDSVEALLRAHGGAPTVEIEFPERPASLDGMGGAWEGPRWRVQSERPIEILQRAMGSGRAFATSIERHARTSSSPRLPLRD
jgi:ABC-2 type transport system ATP-binding protein